MIGNYNYVNAERERESSKPLKISTGHLNGFERALEHCGVYDYGGTSRIILGLKENILKERATFDEASTRAEKAKVWEGLSLSTQFAIHWRLDWQRAIAFAKSAGIPVEIIETEDPRAVKPSPEHYMIESIDQSNIATVLERKVPGLKFPQTLSVDDLPKRDIAFPAVAKPVYGQHGIDKFLLETPDQVQKFIEFIKNTKGVPAFVAQEFIETPSDRFTSYRVLTAASGDVIATKLGYSNLIDRLSQPDCSQTTEPLVDTASPYFLDTRKIVSNSAGSIVLDGNVWSKPIVEEEREILVAHGLDPESPRLPEILCQQSQRIAQILSDIQGGLIFGIDFIQDKNDNFYFLEANINPGYHSFYRTYQKLYEPLKEQRDYLAGHYMVINALAKIAMLRNSS